jgi:bacillithiol biosynthesis cysteine-adding enzyme BshC
VELSASGLLPPLPVSYLAGRDRDLLDPLRLLPPGEPLPRAGAASPPPDRRELARALGVANEAYGHPRAGELARRLADPATRVVVTGQQPGLFGGPLYALTKMVAASRWAAEIEERGEPAVAVFWVATEDHDFDEVASTVLPGHREAERFTLGTDPDPLMPVGMRTLGPELERVYREIRESLEGGDRFEGWLALLGRFYRPDARFGEAFCRLMTALLGEATPLLLDSMLPEVKAAQRPWLARLVERREAVEEALEAADREVRRRGYELQVEPQRGLSPLFLLHRGERRRIEWTGPGWSLRGRGDAGGTVAELAERIEENPAAVSPGVLARPAVQDAILGTSLHLMGPAELSYMTQVAAVYPVLGIEAPWVTLRPHMLILESHQVEQMEEVDVTLEDLLGEREALERKLAQRAGGNPVEAAQGTVETLLEDLRQPLLTLDPNLERPWEKTRDHVLRGLSTLAGKVTTAMARRDEIQARRLDRLREACLPLGRPQERVISASFFAAKYRDRFPGQVWEQMDLDPRRLQVVVL